MCRWGNYLGSAGVFCQGSAITEQKWQELQAYLASVISPEKKGVN